MAAATLARWQPRYGPALNTGSRTGSATPPPRPPAHRRQCVNAAAVDHAAGRRRLAVRGVWIKFDRPPPGPSLRFGKQSRHISNR